MENCSVLLFLFASPGFIHLNFLGAHYFSSFCVLNISCEIRRTYGYGATWCLLYF